MMHKRKIEELSQIVQAACSEGSPLHEMSLVVPNLHEMIVSRVKFALFNKEVKIPPLATRIGGDAENALAQFNMNELIELNSLFTAHHIFSPNVNYPRNTLATVIFNCSPEEVSSAVQIAPIQYSRSSQELLKDWELVATLPPITQFFDLDFSFTDSYILEICDHYEEWAWQIEKKYQRKFLQIGGWPTWVQDGIEQDYVARINNEWGDAGSVYLCFDVKQNQFYTLAQTH